MKLSIITINYNNQKGLLRTIESVLGQANKKFEYVIVDGGSTDGSLSVLEKFSDKLDLWVSEKDSGIYNAMNKGIRMAGGEYCLFLNSGDWLFSATVIDEFEDYLDGSLDIVIGTLMLEGSHYSYVPPNFGSLFFFLDSSIPHPSTFIKKDLFYKIGFYSEDFKIISDYIFFYNAIIKNRALYREVDKPVAFFDMTGISSMNHELLENEHEKFLRDEFPPLVLADYRNFCKLKEYGGIEYCIEKLQMIENNGGMRRVQLKLKIIRFLDPVINIARYFEKRWHKICKGRNQ